MRSRLLGPVLFGPVTLGPVIFGLVLAAVLVVIAGGPAWKRDSGDVGTVDRLELDGLGDPRHEEEAARLLDRWAPTFVQHVADGAAGRDRPTRIDFDGDWDTTNNWDNQAQPGTELPPAVYGAAVLTATHAYLTYTLYYPRDWASPICLPYICHDNDLESVRVVAERGGDLEFIEAKAHLRYRQVRADSAALDARGRPLIAVEGKGHGPRPCRVGDSACALKPDRRVYARGSPPSRADASRVEYELLSLRDTLWPRRHLAQDRPTLWAPGETGPLWYRGARLGRLGNPLGAAMASKRYPGGVRPPWALKGSSGARGDWFFDPAAVALDQFPELAARGSGTLDYAFHPFLIDLGRECAGGRCALPVPPPEPSRAGAWSGMAAMGVLLALWLRRSTRRLSRAAKAPRFDGHKRAH